MSSSRYSALETAAEVKVHKLLRLLHQQGEQSQILMCGVDDGTVLVTVFGKQTTLGLVRFYSARTVKAIATVLQENRASQHVAPVFSTRDLSETQPLFGG